MDKKRARASGYILQAHGKAHDPAIAKEPLANDPLEQRAVHITAADDKDHSAPLRDFDQSAQEGRKGDRTGPFGKHFFPFYEGEDGGSNLVLVNQHHLIHLFSNNGKRKFSNLLHGDAVGNGAFGFRRGIPCLP